MSYLICGCMCAHACTYFCTFVCASQKRERASEVQTELSKKNLTECQFAHANEPTPTYVSNERWMALLSILSSQSAMMSPWTLS